MISSKLLTPFSVLIAAVGLVTLAGCASTVDTGGVATVTDDTSEVPKISTSEEFTVQSVEGVRIISLTTPSDDALGARSEGALTLSSEGCFALTTTDGISNVLVSAQPISLISANSITFGGREFSLGDVVTIGGGGMDPEGFSGSAAAVMEDCGEYDGVLRVSTIEVAK